MKKLIVIAAAAIFSFATASALAADNIKVGVLNIQKVVQQTPEAKQINANLEQEFKPRSEKLTALSKQFQADVANLEKNSPTMQAADREALQKKISEERTEMIKEQATLQQDFAQARAKALENFENQIRAAVTKIAKAGNYNLILTETGGVAYSDGIPNVTDEVVKNLQ